MTNEEFEKHCAELDRLAALRKPKRSRVPKWIQRIEEQKFNFLLDMEIIRLQEQLETFDGRGLA